MRIRVCKIGVQCWFQPGPDLPLQCTVLLESARSPTLGGPLLTVQICFLRTLFRPEKIWFLPEIGKKLANIFFYVIRKVQRSSACRSCAYCNYRPYSKSKLELESNLSEILPVYPLFYPKLIWQNSNLSIWSLTLSSINKDITPTKLVLHHSISTFFE